MPKLVFDIETVGEDFEQMDQITQCALTKWIKKESENENDYQKKLTEMQGEFGLSPLTGQIVAIGVLDVDQNKGVVCFQSPNKDCEEFEEGIFKFKPMTEKEMLENFWDGAKHYREFISFNGRCFDVPFLIARSGANKVKITKDLMSYRFLNGPNSGPMHVDLFDQLSFYGAVRRRNSLHLWCRALGIDSPKGNGVDGGSVTKLFNEGGYIDIAKYNSDDLIATKRLYEMWKEFMKA